MERGAKINCHSHLWQTPLDRVSPGRSDIREYLVNQGALPAGDRMSSKKHNEESRPPTPIEATFSHPLARSKFRQPFSESSYLDGVSHTHSSLSSVVGVDMPSPAGFVRSLGPAIPISSAHVHRSSGPDSQKTPDSHSSPSFTAHKARGHASSELPVASAFPSPASGFGQGLAGVNGSSIGSPWDLESVISRRSRTANPGEWYSSPQVFLPVLEMFGQTPEMPSPQW